MRRLAFARPHHFALHQFGVDLVRSHEIEVRTHIRQELLARGLAAVQYLKNGRLQPRERVIEYSAVDTDRPPAAEGYGAIGLAQLPAALRHARAGTLPKRPNPDNGQ